MNDNCTMNGQEGKGLYLVRLQVVAGADILCRKVLRDIVVNSLKYCVKSKNLLIYSYVIMTNRVYLIARSKNDTLLGTLRDFKRFTSESIMANICKNIPEDEKDWMKILFNNFSKEKHNVDQGHIWRYENYEKLLTSEEMISSTIDFIHQYPVHAGWVENPQDYPYSSSKNYCGTAGPLEIESIYNVIPRGECKHLIDQD